MSSIISMLPVTLAAAMLFLPAFTYAHAEPASDPAAPQPGLKVSGPFTHEKLAVYLIHGPSEQGPVPLTLSEALAKKLFVVHETGNVQALSLENLGEEAVFLQAGDIVKGGRQDRVLTTSVLVPGKSGRMPIGAYCVEQSRWAARGAENVARFESSERYMPSRKAKAAMMANPAPASTGAAGRPAQRVASGDRQQEVWASVAETQADLSAKLGAPVAAPASASSLQLSLENEKLTAAKAAYLAALSPSEKNGADVIGFAFAIDGRINSADVYPSHGLFEKMWGKLIDAAATEAIGDRGAGSVKPTPVPADVLAFLANAANAAAQEQKLDANTVRVTRQNEATVASETKRSDGRVLHKSYVAF